MVLFFIGIFIGIVFGFLACAVLTASKAADAESYPGIEDRKKENGPND